MFFTNSTEDCVKLHVPVRFISCGVVWTSPSILSSSLLASLNSWALTPSVSMYGGLLSQYSEDVTINSRLYNVESKYLSEIPYECLQNIIIYSNVSNSIRRLNASKFILKFKGYLQCNSILMICLSQTPPAGRYGPDEVIQMMQLLICI